MIVCFDFETIKLLPDGSRQASADFWHPDFRVDSCAFSWRAGDTIESIFVQGEDNVRKQLQIHADNQDQMICHNLQFEYGVMLCRYPDIQLNWHADTMRLSQNYDNGGSKTDFDWDLENEYNLVAGDKPKLKRTSLEGLGLVKCVRRILGDPTDHKKEAHDWLLTNVPEIKKKKQIGSYLDRLPPDILERYNIADTENTLRLYEYIITEFSNVKFNWLTDHSLYIPAAKRIAESQKRGLRIDRTKLEAFRLDTINEIATIERKFADDFAAAITKIERRKAAQWIKAPKTKRGRRNRYKKYLSNDDKAIEAYRFNSGSNKQLAELFVDTLGFTPKFFTKKEAPSFKSAHLFQWGDGGQILLNRRKRMIVLKQAEAILRQSEFDGRLHVQLRACGTRTGRFAGTGGVNIQALSRREKRLMECLLPEEGYRFVSTDACLPPETDYLTPRGWVPVMDLKDDDLVWQVDRTTLQGSFVKPLRIIKKPYTGDMVTFSTARGQLTVTADHRMLAMGQYNHTRSDKKRLRMEFIADQDIPSTAAHFSLFSLSDSVSNYSHEHIWKTCMLQADASEYADRPYIYRIEAAKLRKREQIRGLLGSNGTIREPRQHQTLATETWNYIKFQSQLLQPGKKFNLTTLGANQADVFVEALCFWDGSYVDKCNTAGRFTWGTTDRHNAEEIQQYLVKSGYECRLSITPEQENKQTLYRLSIRKHGQIRLFSSKRKRFCDKLITPYNGMVGCVTVPSSYILVRQNGQAYVTGNCAGEPTVITEFTHDPMYKYFVFDGVGKAPYYTDEGLMIDDIYLAYLSRCPVLNFNKEMFDIFTNESFNGKSFSEQWVIDSEVVKNHPRIKKIRKHGKWMALGFGYGLGPRNVIPKAVEAGLPAAPQDGPRAFNAYWNTFKGIKAYANRLERITKADGWFTNPFGYRIVPEEPRKAFNARVQSSVSGLFNWYSILMDSLYPEGVFVTVIHDEEIRQIPIGHEHLYQEALKKVTDEINKELKWCVDMRFGAVFGDNLYEAK